MEVWGGNGYVETGPMARLYREAPVNSIWEGSGNVMCLDVLRAIERDPEGFLLLLADLEAAAAGHAALQPRLDGIRQMLAAPAALRETLARRLAQELVLAAQGALMLRTAPADIADAFLTSRADALHGKVAGTLPGAALDVRILERAFPQ
jgi:putative acyl-CoA dehydrogenase